MTVSSESKRSRIAARAACHAIRDRTGLRLGEGDLRELIDVIAAPEREPRDRRQSELFE